MTLRQKQSEFAFLFAMLIVQAYKLGYEVTLGDVHRSIVEAERLGFKKSLHVLKLAGDLNLFKNGRYQRSKNAHRQLGKWWEKQSTDQFTCHWGGWFGDGNHYSIGYGGRK